MQINKNNTFSRKNWSGEKELRSKKFYEKKTQTIFKRELTPAGGIGFLVNLEPPGAHGTTE